MVIGVWESKPQIIKWEMLRFFRDKFKENVMRRPKLVCYGLKKLTQQDAEGLITGFSAQEVKRAVFYCGADKEPGPDGFNFRFIRTCSRMISWI